MGPPAVPRLDTRRAGPADAGERVGRISEGSPRRAIDLIGSGVTHREGIQAVVRAQTELHRHARPGCQLVQLRVPDRLSEAAATAVAEVVDNLDLEETGSLIPGGVGGRAADLRGACGKQAT